MSVIEKIIKVNKLLVNHFGIPKRNKKLPDPVDMLIATILSQNTNDRNSYKAYTNLTSKYSSWEELSKVRRTTIEKEIKVAGLGLQKSKAIKDFLKDLNKKKHKISLDYLNNLSNEDSIKELTNYNGIGVKTASCVLLFSMDRNICPVDTHVHRTVNRIGLVNENSADKTFNSLNKNFPDKIAHQFHTNLIRLGRKICKPKNPSCGVCPVISICKYNDKSMNNKNNDKENSFMLLDNIK